MTSKVYEGRARIELIHGDCMEGMAGMLDNQFDLAIVDDQTGQDEGKKNSKRPNVVRQKNGSTISISKKNRTSDWDSHPPTQAYYNQLFRVCRKHILMCSNRVNFDQKASSPGRIIWNLLRKNDFGDCQILWTNLFKTIDYFEYMWNGMLQGEAINSRKQIGNKKLNEKRIHDSQKPVKVYKHLLREYAQSDWSILDTKGGSMSLAIACWDLGFDLTCYEIEKGFYNTAVERFENHIKQEQLFKPSEF